MLIEKCNYRIVTDVGIEGCHQHQRFVKKLADPVTIGLDTDDTIFGEGIGAIGQESDRSEYIRNHERFEDVQFEVSIAATNSYCDVVSHHLGCHHCDGFTLRWIHFTCSKLNEKN